MDPVLEQIDSKTLIVKKKMKKNPNATEKKNREENCKADKHLRTIHIGKEKEIKSSHLTEKTKFSPLNSQMISGVVFWVPTDHIFLKMIVLKMQTGNGSDICKFLTKFVSKEASAWEHYRIC